MSLVMRRGLAVHGCESRTFWLRGAGLQDSGCELEGERDVEGAAPGGG